LRKEYPVRREFQNTTVILATESTRLHQGYSEQAEGTEKLAEMLEGIGFKVKK
jgi:hypothetical protein